MTSQEILWVDLGVAIGTLIAAVLYPFAYRWSRRPRMTRFQREILEARMTADDELEYDRIMRALGVGASWVDRPPPQVNTAALYDEVERRYHSKEISLEQYRSEIGELERTYGPTYRGKDYGKLAR